jgi:tRNA (cytidine32/uridine32-2'-O)-methyltransferase
LASNERALLSPADRRQQAATKSQKEGHLEHLQNTLESLDFIKVKPPTVLMRKITRLFSKADLSVEEIQIMRGIYSAMQNRLNQ